MWTKYISISIAWHTRCPALVVQCVPFTRRLAKIKLPSHEINREIVVECCFANMINCVFCCFYSFVSCMCLCVCVYACVYVCVFVCMAERSFCSWNTCGFNERYHFYGQQNERWTIKRQKEKRSATWKNLINFRSDENWRVKARLMRLFHDKMKKQKQQQH